MVVIPHLYPRIQAPYYYYHYVHDIVCLRIVCTVYQRYCVYTVLPILVGSNHIPLISVLFAGILYFRDAKFPWTAQLICLDEFLLSFARELFRNSRSKGFEFGSKKLLENKSLYSISLVILWYCT